MAYYLDDVSDTFADLHRLGFVIRAGSRFDIHRKRLAEAATNIHRFIRPEFDELFLTSISIAETRELASIVRHLHGSSLWRPRIQEMLNGTPFPLDDKKPKARSSQFELYIASRAQANRLFPKPLEPDLQIRHRGWHVSIAAKRMNSRKKISDRIEEATKQIDNIGLPGFIFLEVSRLLIDHECVIASGNRGEMLSSVQALISRHVVPDVTKASERIGSELVKGILVCSNLIGFDTPTGVPVDMFNRLAILKTSIPPKQSARIAECLRCFYADDASMSSMISRSDLAKSFTHRTRSKNWK